MTPLDSLTSSTRSTTSSQEVVHQMERVATSSSKVKDSDQMSCHSACSTAPYTIQSLSTGPRSDAQSSQLKKARTISETLTLLSRSMERLGSTRREDSSTTRTQLSLISIQEMDQPSVLESSTSMVLVSDLTSLLPSSAVRLETLKERLF